jgi:parvulin-like peptidyl-prolyl isomerase
VTGETLSQARCGSHGTRRAKCRNVGTCVAAGVCLAAALVSVAGCDEKNSKKAALTDLEIKQRTLAQKPDRPDRLVVSGETITWEDILASLPDESTTAPPLRERLEKAAKETSLRQFLEEQGPLVQQKLNSRISSIVLSKRAERDLGKKVEEKLNEFSDRELRRFILEEHGGNGAEADEALQKTGMTRVTYKQWKKKQILAKYLMETRFARERPITYGELLARYEEMKDKQFAREGVLQLRLIDIQTDKVHVKAANEDPARQAQQLAEDLRKRVDAGENFGALAKQYSHGLRSEQGGLWTPRDPDALAAPYDVLAKTAQGMEPGQVAGPIEAPGHFFIMRVEQKRERAYQQLSEVQDQVKNDIMDQRWREMLTELDAEIGRQAALADTSRFVNYCLDRFYRQAHERPSAP